MTWPAVSRSASMNGAIGTWTPVRSNSCAQWRLTLLAPPSITGSDLSAECAAPTPPSAGGAHQGRTALDLAIGVRVGPQPDVDVIGSDDLAAVHGEHRREPLRRR